MKASKGSRGDFFVEFFALSGKVKRNQFLKIHVVQKVRHGRLTIGRSCTVKRKMDIVMPSKQSWADRYDFRGE